MARSVPHPTPSYHPIRAVAGATLGPMSSGTIQPTLAEPATPTARSAGPASVTPRVRLILAVVALGILLFPLADLINAALKPNFNGYGGIDYTLYMESTRRWLTGGSFFQPYQLAGPYAIQMGDVLYPPNAVPLFVVFTALPAILWWAIPLGVTAWAIWRVRPAPVAWPFMALCVFWPPMVARTVAGNPVMWVMAAVALGFVVRWAFVGVLLKPSLFPFALLGVRSRWWWVALAVWIAISIPFGTMWLDWLQAVRNSTGGGLLYSLQDVPILLLPVIAARMR
jgi:hypothetical protein